MFTGLIEEIGTIQAIKKTGGGYLLEIGAELVFSDLRVGDSVAVNGVCLTVVSIKNKTFAAEAVAETVMRSNLNALKVKSKVNLERALRADARLGGHFVQGHVDGVGVLSAIEKRDPGYWLTVNMPEELLKYMVDKGSITLNGTSLTIASSNSDSVSVAVIPHTAQSTTLKDLQTGDKINIEVDILGKYIYKFARYRQDNGQITMDSLQKLGFD